MFDFNASINDFIEINLRMLLDYENINESHLVFAAFKLIDDNDGELYIIYYIPIIIKMIHYIKILYL